MLSALIAIVLIVGVGSGIADRIRVRQEEIILAKLPVAEAHAFYETLRRRARKLQILRAITLVSLLVLAYTYKHRITHTAPPAAGSASQHTAPPAAGSASPTAPAAAPASQHTAPAAAPASQRPTAAPSEQRAAPGVRQDPAGGQQPAPAPPGTRR